MDAAEIEDRIAALAETGEEDIDIGEGALLLAALDRPGVGLARYRDHLEDVSATLGRSEAASRAEALQSVLAGEFGYAGDSLTYDDVQNANLMRVIDRRKGLPVALGILFLHAGESAGWPVAGLSFPFYFLIRLDDNGARTVLDPFNGGAALDTHGMREILRRLSGGRMELKPQYYEPVSKREVLMRLQNNIKTRALECGNLARGAEILRRMVSFAPMYMSLWRELAQVEARRGNLNDAFAAAEAYFDRAETDTQRHDAAALMEHLRKQRN